MQKKITLTLAACLFSLSANASEEHHWGYKGDSGPKHWGSLKQEFSTCSTGKNQSPINLSQMVEGNLGAINYSYKKGGNQVVNNGHAIQVNYSDGSTIIIDGNYFDLKQFHFHTPSENHINGQSYPLEAHLVHSDSSGNLAVVAVMFEFGQENSFLKTIIENTPTLPGKEHSLESPLNVAAMLPSNKDHYRFNGSLTTPPCSEGVRWFVLKQPAQVSESQVSRFHQAVGFDNNRPLQALNARKAIR